MKVFFCINEYGLGKLRDRYFEHMIVSIASCRQRTTLEPYIIYSGNPNVEIEYLRDIGANIIYHELSFRGRLHDICEKNKVNFGVAEGAFLRLDIPLLDHSSEFVLYADVDVMFQRDPILNAVRPKIFAAAPEMGFDNFSHANSGVLLINNKELLRKHAGFIEYIVGNNLKTSSGDPYDQGHLNDFFRGEWEPLDQSYNWKPYWGFNKYAPIVHWHGVKYPAAKAISIGQAHLITNYHPHPEIYERCPEAYREYIAEFEQFMLPYRASSSQLLKNTSSSAVAPGSGNSQTTQKTKGQDRVSFLVGPSHVVRWRKHIQDGVVTSSIPAERMLAIGGAPIWSKSLFEKAVAATGQSDRIGVMVGDFRFGNGLCLAEIPDNPVMRDGFVAIERSACTPTCDQQVFDRSMRALGIWHKQFGHRCSYVFWCLFGRQVMDRLSGRYISSGSYHHPLWNYEDVVAQLSELSIVDFGPLLKMQMHEVVRLFVDTSLHPSQIGYLFLEGVLGKGLSTSEAYRLAAKEVEDALMAIAAKLVARSGRRIILTGKSVWLDTLVRYMGAKGAQRIAEIGVILAPLNPSAGQPTISQIRQEVDSASCSIVILSAGGHSLVAALEKAFETNVSIFANVPAIDWEGSVADIIRQRGETPNFAHTNLTLEGTVNSIKLKVNDDMVELGPGGVPSWSGIRHLLNEIASLI